MAKSVPALLVNLPWLAFGLIPDLVFAQGLNIQGGGQAPTRDQIERFCNDYGKLIQSPNLTKEQKDRYEKLYKEHCKKRPAPKPEAPDEVKGQIDRIGGPDCLVSGSEIRVEGRGLQEGELVCRLESKGRRRTMKPYSSTDRRYRYRLNGDLNRVPGPGFRVECEVEGDEAVERFERCPEPEGLPVPTLEEAGAVDLVPELKVGALQAGRPQTVEISVRNLGRSGAENRRHGLLLMLTARDLSQLPRVTTAVRPVAGQALTQKRQWLTRIPGGGESEAISMVVNVPGKLLEGPLFWCAMADSDRAVSEFNEHNNLACVPANGEPQIVARDDLSRLFGSALRERKTGGPGSDPVLPPEQVEILEGDAPIGVGSVGGPAPESAVEGPTENHGRQLVDTLPPRLVPLAGESGILYVDDKIALASVTRSDPLVSVSWNTTPGTGIYLRWSTVPLGDCPDAGTPLSDGESDLDRLDGIRHELRQYHSSNARLVYWDLNDPVFEDRVRYYFQGCLVDNAAAEFLGIGTNVVQGEIVERLPDLVIRSAHVFESGSRLGQIVVWVRDAESPSDILDREFAYQITAQRLRADEPFEINASGAALLDADSSAVIDLSAAEFQLPYDGEQYEVTVTVNPDRIRGITESDYSNNSEVVTWMKGPPVVLIVESIEVKENCDQRSPGEWQVNGRMTNGFYQTRPFQSGYEFKVEDYTRYPTDPDAKGFLVFKAFNHPINRNIRIEMNFEDCNHLLDECPEEWREHPFGMARPSFPGRVSATLTPENRMRGDSVSIVARDGNCGGEGYVATFRLLDSSRARSEGYEAGYTFYFPSP